MLTQLKLVHASYVYGKLVMRACMHAVACTWEMFKGSSCKKWRSHSFRISTCWGRDSYRGLLLLILLLLLSLFLLHPSRVRVGGEVKRRACTVWRILKDPIAWWLFKNAHHIRITVTNARSIFGKTWEKRLLPFLWLSTARSSLSLSILPSSPPTTHPSIPVPTPPPPMPLSRARGLGCTCACSAGCWCCSCVGVQQDSHQHTDCLPCILDVSSSWWRNPSAARVNVSPWACGPPWPPSSYSTF